MRKLEQDPIPSDLLINIFSRVPAKSIARFRCVSKFWESILGRPDFSELFLTRSSTCPRLLFTLEDDIDKLIFYSSPHPQNLDDDDKSSLVATRYHTFSSKYYSTTSKYFSAMVCYPLHGLVCIQDWERGDTVQVVFNPITGESITLPKLQVKNINNTRSYLGYDPIDKQFKVLCVISMSSEHRVLTLETGKDMVWRSIKCKPHYLPDANICINGVLYFRAWCEESCTIVCFDVRSENFSFINVDASTILQYSDAHWTLINYKGKLGAILYKYWIKTEFVLLVLEDVGKHKWTKHTCILPPLWQNVYIDALNFAGMTSTTGEIVVSPDYISDPFYVFYFNPEKSTFRRVGIKGFEGVENHTITNIFSDYIEDVKLMQSV